MPNSRGISTVTLKLIAVIAMTIDHYAWIFVPTATPIGQLLHAIGRMTAPIMAFCIAEGYFHTRNRTHYALRLAVFALLSHLPYVYYATGLFTVNHDTGVIFTLFLGLLALITAKNPNIPVALKLLILTFLFWIAQAGDWGHYVVLWVLAFGLLRERRNWAMAASAAITLLYFGRGVMLLSIANWGTQLFRLGGLLVIPLLLLYSGQPGRLRLKYFFYFYYPFHLVALRLLYSCLF